LKHGLTRLVLEEGLFLEITPVRFAEITVAATSLRGALDIEEKYNLVLENFEEFEAELLNNALRRSLFQTHDWSEAITELHRLNRRLVNFLATCRLYVDQVPHNLSQLFGTNSSIAVVFETSKSREFDARLGYRVMDAMRNYIQHRSLPIHVISYQLHWRDLPAGRFREHTVVPEVETAKIREDGKFKPTTLTELEALGAQVDLTPLVRQYVAGLAMIHKDLRASLATHLEQWDQTIAQAGMDFVAAGASDLTGLAVVKEENEAYTDEVYVSPTPTTRRQWLERKNSHIEHYEAALVASRPVA